MPRNHETPLARMRARRGAGGGYTGASLKGLGRQWRKLPPIPATVHSAVGPIAVTHVAGLTGENGDRLAGRYNWERRTIELNADLAPASAWLTLKHEWVHAVMADAGVMFPASSYEDSLEERVCNTIAHALVSEMLTGG